MKYKTTRKTIVDGCNNIKSCGYAEISTLLQMHPANAYTCGVYGWNFDVYEVGGVTICTGYRNMPGERLKHCKEYEKKARELWSFENKLSYNEKCEAAEKLLKEFCKLNGGY